MNAPKRLALLTASLLLAASTSAQDYSVHWHAIASGGGSSSGGQFQISGTIGQPEVTPTTLAGGPYTVQGGFWPAWTIAPTEEFPTLTIQWLPRGLVISWPASATAYSLQETSQLDSEPWTPSSVANGIPFVPSNEVRFFRLAR